MAINQDCLQNEWGGSWTEDEDNNWMDEEEAPGEEDEQWESEKDDSDEGCSAVSEYTSPNNVRYDSNNNVKACRNMESDRSQDECTVGFPATPTNSHVLPCKSHEEECFFDEESAKNDETSDADNDAGNDDRLVTHKSDQDCLVKDLTFRDEEEAPAVEDGKAVDKGSSASFPDRNGSSDDEEDVQYNNNNNVKACRNMESDQSQDECTVGFSATPTNSHVLPCKSHEKECDIDEESAKNDETSDADQHRNVDVQDEERTRSPPGTSGNDDRLVTHKSDQDCYKYENDEDDGCNGGGSGGLVKDLTYGDEKEAPAVEDGKAVDKGSSASFPDRNGSSDDEEDVQYNNNNNVEACRNMESDQSQDECTVGSPATATNSHVLPCKSNEKEFEVNEESVSCVNSEADKYEDCSSRSPANTYHLEVAIKNYETSDADKHSNIEDEEPATSGNDDRLVTHKSDQDWYKYENDEVDSCTAASISTSGSGGLEKDLTFGDEEEAPQEEEGSSASFPHRNGSSVDVQYDDNNNVKACLNMDNQSQDECVVGPPDTSTNSDGSPAVCKRNEEACDVDSAADKYRLEVETKKDEEDAGGCHKNVDENGNEERSMSLPATPGNDDRLVKHKSDQDYYTFESDNGFTSASISTSGSETGGSEKDLRFRDEEQQMTNYSSEDSEDEYDEHCHFEDSDDDEEEEDVYLKKLYSDPEYPTAVFQTMESMMRNHVLTDLVLYTEDGEEFHVHSIVLAAVSYYIQSGLRQRNRHQRGFTLCLGPEVHSSGLAAVVEFAYTGMISILNKDNLEIVWSASISLEAPNVLELCRQEEQRQEDKARGKNVERKWMSAEAHLHICMQNIRQMWASRVGSDVEIEAGGRVFHAHRVILAASSDYFRGMFTSGMKESRQKLVSLLLIKANKFETLLHYCYCGALALGWGCVFNLACTSLQLQFQTAFALCIKFLHQEIDAHSCLDVASFAEAYGMLDLLAFANDFVLRHFQDVSITPKFLDLSVEKLKNYLQSDSLCVSSELSVFKAVMAWIEDFPRQRVKRARELMGTIQFHLMTYREFKEVKSITTLPRIGAKQLYESLLEEFCCGSPDVRTHFRAYMPKNALVLVGGERITNNLDKRFPCRELWFSNSLQNYVGLVKKVEWRMLGTLPEKPRFSHGVGAMRGKLYIVGGRHYYGKDDTMNCTYRYDPMQNSWQRLADMHEKRGSFTLVVLNGKIYAIGGERDSEVNMESVEVYCSNKNSWSFVRPLDHALCCHAASVWNGKILVSGGFDSQYRCLSSMILYHPESGSTYRAEMMKDRALHCMETLGDRLYVAGGVSSNAGGNLQDQLACEVYDPIANSWSAIMSLSVPHVGSASAVLEGKIYVIGGYSHEDYSDTKSVHRYDPSTGRWDNMSLTPGPNTYIAACVLPVPAHLRQ